MKIEKVIAVAGLMLSACAPAGDAPPSSGLHVDTDNVVKEGAVVPIDGITSSGQPDQAALEVFSESGYTAVIDLRGESEDRGMDEKEAVESLGMEYVLFPIESREAISFENAAELDKLIESYDAPVLIHCASGNRVGAMLALRQSLKGANDEAAIKYGRDGGLTGLEDVVKERLGEK
jgi:uncharacterized protein (TIGR01244 family)